MSQRRQANEIVIKKENAGFTGERLRVRILPDDDEPVYGIEYCALDCGDDKCKVWPSLDVLDESDSAIGQVYHVSECEMESD